MSGVAFSGARLRSERCRSGLSLRDLSAVSGYSHGYLGALENGKKSPLWSTVFVLAKSLETETMAFMVKV